MVIVILLFFTTGDHPLDVAINVSKKILYVFNDSSDTLIFFNAVTDGCLFGDLASFSFPTEDNPSSVCLHENCKYTLFCKQAG